MPKSELDLTRYQPFYTPLAIFLGGLAIAAAIVITGGLGGSPNVAGEAALPTDSGEPQILEVSVDDDPVLGDPNAPITMIEFSDFECFYCKGFHDETLPQIKEAYIDTGEVKFVYRDLPLSFHDPAATKDALAANCARDQGGDEAYFKYHDKIYAQSAGNGGGMGDAVYGDIAGEVGLDISEFNSCLSSDRFKDEVAKDLADAEEIAGKLSPPGIGTPTFFIGKSDASGTIEGQVVSGAQPFNAFQQIIDELLSQ